MPALGSGTIRRLAAPLTLGLILASPASIFRTASADDDDWTRTFATEECDWASTGRNPFFILEPGYQLVLAGTEDDEPLTLTITVLDETETVAGVETRVVEEREETDGELVEVSRNFFAICAPNNGVFYFGEDVDNYEDGEIYDHDGAWRAGEDGAEPGLIMPGLPLIGARYYQEIAPDIAMDRAEVVSLTATLETPAGTFENCLETQETTPLEPDQQEQKIYARGIGIIQDAGLKLVSAPAATPAA